MQHLIQSDLIILFVSLGLLLGAARIGGELAQRWSQPAVLGEILAGVLLGPTVLGTLAPHYSESLFPQSGPVAVAREGFITLAIILFILVAGMEVDLSRAWRQGRAAILVGLAGIVVPFAVGLLAGRLAPIAFGRQPQADGLIFSLFLGVALSISALPVIAKTLFDLNIYHSDMGVVVISAAIFNDLIGWTIFAMVLGMLEGRVDHQSTFIYTAGLTIGFAAFMLTAVRWLINRSLPWIQAHTSWPGGVLGFAIVMSLFGAASTEWLGIHAIFGSFLMGIAIGDSAHLREQTRSILSQFISFSFAPIFFAGIGLRVNFYEHFDPLLALAVLLIACAGKVIGCMFGARLGGMSRREAWAVGFGMNARGAMEIILGLTALQHGLIDERMFVALVIMAIVTSVLGGPMMRWILQLQRPRELGDLLGSKGFVGHMNAWTSREAIGRLSAAAAKSGNLDPKTVETAVLEREALMPTGIGHGIAIPHARIEGLARPVVAVALSHDGIDFNAPDGEPAKLMFLVLTDFADGVSQVSILADIARKFGREELRRAALEVQGYTEFMALLRTAAPPA